MFATLKIVLTFFYVSVGCPTGQNKVSFTCFSNMVILGQINHLILIYLSFCCRFIYQLWFWWWWWCWKWTFSNNMANFMAPTTFKLCANPSKFGCLGASSSSLLLSFLGRPGPLQYSGGCKSSSSIIGQ